jgi:DNA primase
MSTAVEQIKDRLSVIDVVGKYVELHKAGRHFKGKSPFTNERTPSFYVSPDRGMYYCFSTNQGGDIFTFIQTIEGVEFKEALRILAEQANVELVPEAPERRSARDRMYQILEAATDFFTMHLRETTEARVYLKQRGVHEQTIRSWRIGYAPGPPHSGWRELRTALQNQGYTDAEMLAAGLIKYPDAGKDPFDVFRDRIVFPMYDAQGRVVAFSGRILHANERAPKYVNSPETELYKKSSLLFGYDRAKHGVRSLGFWIAAEGQFDVIMSHQAGYTNTVAVSGTALTTEHVRQLERLCTRVVLALDADQAGVNAMQKAATVMLERGLDVKVATLPEGKDPADLVAEEVESYKRLIGQSKHVIDFLLTHLEQTSRDERTFKLRVREELLPFVVRIPNEIDQEHFIQHIATHTSTTPDAVRHEVQRLRELRDTSRNDLSSPAHVLTESNATHIAPSSDTYDRAQELLAYLVAATEVIPASWREAVQQLVVDITQESWDTLVARIATEKQSEYTFLVERAFDANNERGQAEEIADRCNQLHNYYTVHRIAEVRSALSTAEAAGDDDEVAALLPQLQELQHARAREPWDSNFFLNLSSLD